MTHAVTDSTPASDLRRRYAGRLHQLRLQAGLTQDALAKAVGLRRQYIGQVEAGAVNISLENLHKLLRFFAPDGNGRPLTERLAGNLKEIRGDLAQETFASRLELPVLLISRLERQAVVTTIDQVARIASKLGIEGEELLE
jgi:transcriptional regulator with XRE-family HTH domain